VNFRRGADQPWVPPSELKSGWHKDGSYFLDFLDSREQSRLSIALWSDVAPRGVGTFIAPDFIGVVARYLRDHPEGVEPDYFGKLIGQCREFVEVTGPAGIFVLRGHMNLNRKDPREVSRKFSLLERTTLHALGIERLDFQPTVPRRSDWTIRG